MICFNTSRSKATRKNYKEVVGEKKIVRVMLSRIELGEKQIKGTTNIVNHNPYY